MPSLLAPGLLASSEARLAEIRRIQLPGYGTIRESDERFRYTIRVLNRDHVEQVWTLQQTVLAPLSPPLPLYVRDQAFFLRCMKEVGCVVGALHEGRLIAYATLHAPESEEENLGVDLDLPDSELRYVAHLAGSAVDPVYRGNHLQSHLVDLREAFARQAGFRHLCGEVVPDNSISIGNHLTLGYLLKGFRIDCLGEPNFVLDKELRRQPRLLTPFDLRETVVDDVVGFLAMIRDGRWGFRTVNRQNGPHIVFGRFAQRDPIEASHRGRSGAPPAKGRAVSDAGARLSRAGRGARVPSA